MENLILIHWGSVTLFLLVLMRMSGFVAFSPIFAREGVPATVQSGFALILAILVFGLEGGAVDLPNTTIQLMLMMLSELLLGMILSLILNFFFAIPTTAGSILDTQIGFGMAQSYDPGSGATVSVSAHILTAMMYLIFFAANGHHTLLRIMLTSSEMVPFGGAWVNHKVSIYAIELFAECMLFAFKLALPIMAAELLGQVGMGFLMKAIPQINVFVINIDLKILVGLGLLGVFIPSISTFLLEIEVFMLQQLRTTLLMLAGSG